MLSYLFLLLLCLTSAAADDLAALRSFSAAVGGRTLHWNLSAQTPCSFRGVVCNSAFRIVKLRLPAAGLSGQLPASTLGNLTALRILSLRRNSLSGRLPDDLPPGLRLLYLQDNNFSGEIPETLFSLSALKQLVLSGNRISDEISPELNRLGQLQILYLQNNDLSGSIPELNNLTHLRSFNVSYNNLTGPIPRSLQKFNSDSFINTSLCGLPMSPCNNGGKKDNKVSAGAIAGIVIGSTIGLIAFLVILFILWRRHRKSSSASRTQPRADRSPATPALPELEVLERKYSKSSENGVTYGDDGMVLFEKEGWGFGLEDLLRASAEILGKGTIGSSYRAYLGNGAEVVVKRLRNVCVGEKEFRERVEGFGRLRHENLVVMKGYYFGKEEKLLVYESLPLGSLASLLHGYRRADMGPLTWDERVRIASGAARGICYLHSKGDTSVHGNIKSSNILLTDECIARVSEFCINQLVSNTSTLGHNGYCAPEVIDTCKVSQKADIYSFGVVLLELVSGKAPDEGGMDLPQWIQTVKEKGASVFDDELVSSENEKTDEMVRVLQLGIECTSIHPDKRPVMIEVATALEELNRWR